MIDNFAIVSGPDHRQYHHQQAAARNPDQSYTTIDYWIRNCRWLCV